MYISVKIRGKTAKINSDHISVLLPEDHGIILSNGDREALSLDDYNEIEAALFPKRKKVAGVNSEKAELLQKLHTLVKGKSAVIPTPERIQKLNKLLLTFSEDQLITAATNIGNDKFLQGENDRNTRYGKIDFLLRPEKAAQWAEFKPEDKRKPLF